MSVLQKKPTQVIILLGPPGAGKGSQAALVKADQKIAHISTGDLLRAEIETGSEIGRKAKTFIEAGQLVPDDLIFDMLFAKTSEESCKNGYMLDGFPRNLTQAVELQKRLQDSRIITINLKINDDILIERITKRQICKACQTPYHPIYCPSKKPGTCDRCDEKLFRRTDDTEEILKQRLKIYHEETAPLIQFYRESGTLLEIDSARSKDAILLDILRVLRRR